MDRDGAAASSFVRLVIMQSRVVVEWLLLLPACLLVIVIQPCTYICSGSYS